MPYKYLTMDFLKINAEWSFCGPVIVDSIQYTSRMYRSEVTCKNTLNAKRHWLTLITYIVNNMACNQHIICFLLHRQKYSNGLLIMPNLAKYSKMLLVPQCFKTCFCLQIMLMELFIRSQWCWFVCLYALKGWFE